jgi:hypothetical protein
LQTCSVFDALGKRFLKVCVLQDYPMANEVTPMANEVTVLPGQPFESGGSISWHGKAANDIAIGRTRRTLIGRKSEPIPLRTLARCSGCFRQSPVLD